MAEVEALGGMTKAIEAGIPKMRIEEAAARKQARIDSGQECIVGVNAFRAEEEEELQTLEVDNRKVRRQQLARLREVKKTRDPEAVSRALETLQATARTKWEASAKGKKSVPEADAGNLLALAVEAARARATLGEISGALEAVFGRHKAVSKSITGVYSKEIKNNEDFRQARELADRFARKEGRRPRILIAKMGQDGHDRGARVVATGYADLGFDVDIGPLFQTPPEVAKQAVENDVHLLGISSLAGGHSTLVPQLISELKKYGRDDIRVVVGGVVPAKDHPALLEAGVLAVFGPGTSIPLAAAQLLRHLLREPE